MTKEEQFEVSNDAIAAGMSVIATCTCIRQLDVSIRDIRLAMELLGFVPEQLVAIHMMVAAGELAVDDSSAMTEIVNSVRQANGGDE